VSDVFTEYEIGIQRLLKRLGDGHPNYTDALLLQARLLDNLKRVRRYGETPDLRADRMQIVDEIIKLAWQTEKVNFNDLSASVTQTQHIQLIIDRDVPGFTDERRDILLRILATVLQVEPEDVRILHVQ
jgi:uncharacterized ubiquitin-like protein YukD